MVTEVSYQSSFQFTVPVHSIISKRRKKLKMVPSFSFPINFFYLATKLHVLQQICKVACNYVARMVATMLQGSLQLCCNVACNYVSKCPATVFQVGLQLCFKAACIYICCKVACSFVARLCVAML